MSKAATRQIYMVMRNPGRAVFVKELDFFHEQGGFKDTWGYGWTPVVATSIEHVRRIGGGVLP